MLGIEICAGNVRSTTLTTSAVLVTIFALSLIACGCGGSGSGGEGSESTTTPPSTSAPTPTASISVSPNAIVLGSSASLTWSSTNATSCTASGSWSGTQPTSGTISVTPGTGGVYDNYTLVCESSAGAMATGSSVLTVAYPAPSGPLSQVRSFEYAIAATVTTPGIYTDIANSLADLVILNYTANSPALNKSAADPTGKKLIFGYLDVSEASSYTFPSLFASTPLPSWFGNQNPGFSGLYTVQYWNPAWEPLLFQSIDAQVAAGYDGIFLDVLGGANEWSAGNPEGNPVYAEAFPAMETLLTDIRNYVKTNYPNKAFYLIGNDTGNTTTANVQFLKNLDAIFNEVAYYGQNPTNGQVSVYEGTSSAASIVSNFGPLYAAVGVPVFGNDYPTPLSDASADLLSFDLYSSLGWIPSVTTPLQTANIFSTGPFMFMATSTSPTVTGYPNFVNFISGGKTNNATLVGGNQGDYFIGGPGQNTITGGSGNDTIYAHPQNASQKNQLIFSLSSTLSGSVTTHPSVAISVNGQVVVQPTQITAATGTSTQTIDVDATAYSSISSVSLIVTGTNFIDQSDFSNVEIDSISYNGVNINLAAGVYSSGSGTNFIPYSNNGTVAFTGSPFQVISPFPSNTSDLIDGGGGANSVVYRAAYSNYTVAQQTNGSWLVTSKSTAEGPDTLTNIGVLVFSDQQITLP
jgi:uncharacterized protein (TIGR01370 family)